MTLMSDAMDSRIADVANDAFVNGQFHRFWEIHLSSVNDGATGLLDLKKPVGHHMAISSVCDTGSAHIVVCGDLVLGFKEW